MNHVITIGRQFGSGGHEVGRRLSAKYGIPFYDKELLTLTAEDSNFDESFLNKMDEKRPDFISMSVSGFYSGPDMNLHNYYFSKDDVFLAVGKKMHELAEKGSCVFIGRCSDYVLRDLNPINIFICAKIEERIKRKFEIGKHPDFTEKEMKKHIEDRDKKRSKFYEYYSHEKWGECNHYHLCIDTSYIGVDGAVNLISQYLDDYGKGNIMPDNIL